MQTNIEIICKEEAHTRIDRHEISREMHTAQRGVVARRGLCDVLTRELRIECHLI